MADIGHERTDKLIKETEKKVAREYARAQKEVQRKLERYFARVQAEAEEKRQQYEAGEISLKDYKDWILRKTAMGKRWEDLRDNLAEDYHNANQIAKSIVKGYQADVYALNHNYATYQIEHDGGIDSFYTLYDKATVERLIRDDQILMPPPGPKMKAQIAANKDMQWNMQQLQSALTQAVLQGESIPEFAKRISNTVAVRNYNSSVRYARTMMTSAENAGRYDGYRRATKMGIDLTIEWSATLDGRTRHDHRMMHGQRREVDEPFVTPDGFEIMYPADCTGESDVPQHEIWNCRCTLLAWVKGFEGDTVTDSPKMGEMSFDEWQHEHEPKKPEKPKAETTGKFGGQFLGGKMTQTQLGQQVLNMYGVPGIPVQTHTRDSALGYCLEGVVGGKGNVTAYSLKSNDNRSLEYKLKTAYHEGYHAANHGRLTDMWTISDKAWTNIEETFAESSAHYLISLDGITGLTPSYADKLVKNLPKLQQLDDFKDCVTIADFGKVAYDKRMAGEGSIWKDLSEYVSKKKMNYAKYASKYVEDIKGYGGIVDKILENMPDCKPYKSWMENDLQRALDDVQRGVSKLSGNEQLMMDNAIAIIMGTKGVKPL